MLCAGLRLANGPITTLAIFPCSGGEGGIRTHAPFRVTRFSRPGHYHSATSPMFLNLVRINTGGIRTHTPGPFPAFLSWQTFSRDYGPVCSPLHHGDQQVRDCRPRLTVPNSWLPGRDSNPRGAFARWFWRPMPSPLGHPVVVLYYFSLCVSSLKTTLWSPHTLQHSFLQQTGALGEIRTPANLAS